MYKLGESRVLASKKEGDELSILLKDGSKCIELTSQRWITFVLHFEDIVGAVKKLREKEYVKFFQHIGGGWYISVTTGFWCVDVRRFYKNREGEIKPTREGLALRLREWEDLRVAVPNLLNEHPQLAAVLPCYLGDDHLNQIGYLRCPECCPFDHYDV
jgi:hypothetical protein